MNRRRFLSILAGAGAASATSYFFAPIGGWKSDVIVNPLAGRDAALDKLNASWTALIAAHEKEMIKRGAAFYGYMRYVRGNRDMEYRVVA